MSNKIEVDDEEEKYTREDMLAAFTAGHCSSEYRGRVTAASNAKPITLRACEATFEHWMGYMKYDS